MVDVVEENVETTSTKEPEVNYKELYEKEVPALKAKMEELLNETKAAKQAKKELASKKEQEELEISRKNGEFEKLLKKAEEREADINKKYNELLGNIKSEKIKNASMKVASELANKPENAELLSYFLEQKFSALADENGSVSDDVMSSVKKEFESNSKFSSLVAGRQSTGGGAPGSSKTKSVSKELSRAEFEALSHASRKDFLDSKGILVD